MASNAHATAVDFGGHGVLVTGASGSGKTGLALALLAHAKLWGLEAMLVADDQVYLSTDGAALIASVPEPLAGLIEVRGIGPTAIAHRASVRVDLAIRLVRAADAPRLRDPETLVLAGVEVPSLTLLAGDRFAAAMAVAAHFGLPPFAAA